MEMTSLGIRNIQFADRRETSFVSIKVYSALVALMVLMDTYTVPFLPFLGCGEFLFLILFPFLLLSKKKKKKLSGSDFLLVFFCLYGLLVSLLSFFLVKNNLSDVTIRVVREAFYFAIIFWLGNGLFSFDYFKKIFLAFVYVLAAFVVVQALIFYLFGYFIPGLFLRAQINDNGVSGQEMYNSLLVNASYSGYLKPNGFLTEPSTCAHCFFICLIILLFKETNKRKLLMSIFVSVAMLATMSTSAFLELFLVWSIWLFIRGRKKVLLFLTLLFLFLILIIFCLKNAFFVSVIDRFFSAFSGDNNSMSSGIRIVRGFTIFNSLPLRFKIIGIGFGSYESAVSQGIISPLSVTDIENEYMNSFSYILLSTGIIGTSVLSLYYFSLFRKVDVFGRMLIVGLAFLFFGSSVYCTDFFVIFMLLIFTSRKQFKRCQM